MPAIRESCENGPCSKVKHHFEECEKRVSAGKGFKGEDCVEELFHMLHCVDNCVRRVLLIRRPSDRMQSSAKVFAATRVRRALLLARADRRAVISLASASPHAPALQQCGMTRVYPTRTEGWLDMRIDTTVASRAPGARRLRMRSWTSAR